MILFLFLNIALNIALYLFILLLKKESLRANYDPEGAFQAGKAKSFMVFLDFFSMCLEKNYLFTFFLNFLALHVLKSNNFINHEPILAFFYKFSTFFDPIQQSLNLELNSNLYILYST